VENHAFALLSTSPPPLGLTLLRFSRERAPRFTLALARVDWKRLLAGWRDADSRRLRGNGKLRIVNMRRNR
jgi:hypothetical protein